MFSATTLPIRNSYPRRFLRCRASNGEACLMHSRPWEMTDKHQKIGKSVSLKTTGSASAWGRGWSRTTSRTRTCSRCASRWRRVPGLGRQHRRSCARPWAPRSYLPWAGTTTPGKLHRQLLRGRRPRCQRCGLQYLAERAKRSCSSRRLRRSSGPTNLHCGRRIGYRRQLWSG